MKSVARNRGVALVCIDLDGTLVGNPKGVERFTRRWNALGKSKRPRLCYNTSRSVENTLANLARMAVPPPDFIIGSLGSEIYDCSSRKLFLSEPKHFGRGWNRLAMIEAMVAFDRGRQHPEEFSHEYKLSWRWECASVANLRELKIFLRQRGLLAGLVYSGSRDLDLIPMNSGKGPALLRLCRENGVPLENVVVGGDTSNDISLILTRGPSSFVVDNSHPELLGAALKAGSYICALPMADGVIEALIHFGVFRKAASRHEGQIAVAPELGKNVAEDEAAFWSIINWQKNPQKRRRAVSIIPKFLFGKDRHAAAAPWIRLLRFRAMVCAGELLGACGRVVSARRLLRRAQFERGEIQKLCRDPENILLIPPAFVWNAIDIDQAAGAVERLEALRNSSGFPTFFWIPYLNRIGLGSRQKDAFSPGKNRRGRGTQGAPQFKGAGK